MKNYKLLFILVLLVLSSCQKDDEFLKETPKDFLTLDNGFLNFAQFKTGLNELYRWTRYDFTWRDTPDDYFHFGSGTDILFLPHDDNLPFTDWSYINETTNFLRYTYGRHYQLIYYTNTILEQSENPEVTWNNDQEKLQVQAEARFFRAYGYRYLSYLFGGVPIVDHVVEEPRLDFTRDSREDVYKFIIEDLKFASENLPESTTEPGRVVKAAADHYLAEVYVALGDETGNSEYYQKAIEASSRVIDGTDGDYHLMQDRFGWRKDVEGKDVYWDLFQMRSPDSYSNFNYQNGNKEAVWVIQIDNFLPGGLISRMPRTDQERVFWPAFWAWRKFGYTPPARDWTGRGIAWLRPTNHFLYDIWKNDDGDIRNDPDNIQRIYYAPPPVINGVEDPDYDTTYVTQVTLADGTPYEVKLKPGDPIKKEWLTTRQDTMINGFPRVMKMGSDFHYNEDPSNGFAKEYYAIRLPETYLVRAEAYMKAGDLTSAAEDINTVRARSNAPLITASDVDIDYILDERARELFGEEMRTLTLCRLGLLYDRTKRFGYEVSGNTVQPKNNLMPIPQSVIDANSQADFPQNPGY